MGKPWDPSFVCSQRMIAHEHLLLSALAHRIFEGQGPSTLEHHILPKTLSIALQNNVLPFMYAIVFSPRENSIRQPQGKSTPNA